MKTSEKSISFVRTADIEYQRWMARYLPVEREIMAERDRREERRWQRRQNRNRALSRAFGDLCEVTDGRASNWRKGGFCSFEMAFEIATDRSIRNADEKYFRLSGQTAPQLPRFTDIASSLILMHFILTLNLGAVISCCALQLVKSLAGKAIADLKHRAARPLYYEREIARRRALAADRRRIVKRTTINACPTKEAVLEAYIHRKDSKDAAIRFGSMIHDLECYVDNSLRFADGRITGRNQGVKGWFSDNIPALVCKYTTIMRYKAAAKKLKQLTELDDPQPAEAVLVGEESVVDNKGASDGGKVMSDEKPDAAITVSDEKVPVNNAADDAAMDVPGEKVLRAIAIYRELAEGVRGATQMMARIDAFLDPERVEEATTLAVWRERYKNEITVRNKLRWWRRFTGKGRRSQGRDDRLAVKNGKKTSMCIE